MPIERLPRAGTRPRTAPVPPSIPGLLPAQAGTGFWHAGMYMPAKREAELFFPRTATQLDPAVGC